MSKEHTEIITCPECGKKSDFTVWDSLNTMIDPEEKEKIINGELFRFTCPECGFTTMVDYAILYHQMEDSIMIYYVLSDEGYEQAYEFCTGKKLNGDEPANKIEELLSESMKDYLYRIVRSQNSLREKIRIFDDGKDDRVIELMKLFITASLNEQQPELEEFELYYDGDKESNVFAIVTGDGASMAVTAPDDMYDSISDNFSERLPNIKDKKDLQIDLNWALRFISESN